MIRRRHGGAPRDRLPTAAGCSGQARDVMSSAEGCASRGATAIPHEFRRWPVTAREAARSRGEVARHLARCGCSVDGDPPHREATRYTVVFHDGLDTNAWRERHRPMLESFRSRGVRIIMLHVDSTNRITLVERDLAEPGLVMAR